MDDSVTIMGLAGKGYCCSQILLLLALRDMDRENPDLIRAAEGLGKGLGDCSGPCGVLLGGAAFLGLYAGKGEDMEQPRPELPAMLDDLRAWFAEATSEFCGMACKDITGGECKGPDPMVCGGLIADGRERLLDILADHGLDPAEGRSGA